MKAILLILSVLALTSCTSAKGRPMVEYDALKDAYETGLLKATLDARCVKGPEHAPIRVIGFDGKEVYASVPRDPALIDPATCKLLRASIVKRRAVSDTYQMPPSQLDIEHLMQLGGMAAGVP